MYKFTMVPGSPPLGRCPFIHLSDQRMPAMKTMMRSAAAAGTMAVLLAACSGSPTVVAGADVGAPSYDGGFTVGSGNREAPADSTTTEANTTSSDSTGRGGFTVGSGN